MTTMNAKKNMLDGPTKFNICKLLEERKQEIETGKWSMLSFANYCTNKFRRPVTNHNIRKLAGDVGVVFPVSENRKLTIMSMRQMQAAIKCLAEELTKLAGEAGSSVSPEVLAIAEQYTNHEDNNA